MHSIELWHGDCLELMNNIPDNYVDCIISDLPYGTTKCKWDVVIPFDALWEQYNRIIKDNGAIVLFGSEPFSSYIRISNIKGYKYDWVWEKSKAFNFVHAKNMPIKFHENIMVFSKAPIGHKKQLGDRRMCYNPQGLIRVNKTWSRPKKYDGGENGHHFVRKSHLLSRIIEYENYPTTILKFSNSSNKERGKHATQKPVDLLEYLIKTYTNVGETVLDSCMGSGSTGVAAKNTNRNFIGIEMDSDYYNVAKERIYGM